MEQYKKCTDRIHAYVTGSKPLRWLISFVPMLFCYGVFLFLYEVKFMRQMVPVIHPVLIAWAVLVAAYSFFIRRDWRNITGWPVLAAFVVTALITAVLNRETGLVVNVKAVVMTLLPIFAFLPAFLSMSAQVRKRNLFWVFSGMAVVMLVCSVISLGMYLTRFSQIVELEGELTTIGIESYFNAVVLTGIYEDSNHTAMYALCTILLSIFFMAEAKKGLFAKAWQNTAVTVFCAVNTAVQLSYFPLANSRGGWLSLGLGLAVAAFLYFAYGRGIGKPALRRAGTAVVAAVLVAAVVFGGLFGLRSIWAAASHSIAAAQQETPETEESKPAETEDPEQSQSGTELPPAVDSFEKPTGNGGAGRISIWQDALALYRYHPIFGTNAGNNIYYGELHTPGNNVALGRALHNSYLDLLLNYGAVGLVIMMAFFLWCIVKIIAAMVRGMLQGVGHYLLVCAMVVIAGTAMFLSCVFINTTATAFLLFLILSYLLAELRDRQAIKE